MWLDSSVILQCLLPVVYVSKNQDLLISIASLAHLAVIGLCLMDVNIDSEDKNLKFYQEQLSYVGELCASLLDPVHSQFNSILHFDIISDFNFHFHFQFPFPGFPYALTLVCG